MKKVALLVVGLVLFSLPLFAGEYLMNDTGETVYGLCVVFSEPVELTGFGDVLNTVKPTGKATEFVFSGGELDAWAGHWFNWEPVSVTMLTYEWYTSPMTVEIPEGGLTREDLLNLGRPPTYEEIMSAIAEYPGADEPLYEPSPDEAIWLTDLEGHADIYDNDSIKINYADWFDKSQVTEIEVYRNGIKMRFLPGKFDVLTNEQMKTFDGNPMEHSPESSHTNHAIFGYQFVFQVHSINEVVTSVASVLPPLTLSSKALVDVGVTYFYPVRPSDDELCHALAAMRAMGFSGISVTADHFMETDTTTEISPQYEMDPRLWGHTPTDQDLKRVFRLADEAGLDVEFRVEVGLTHLFRQEKDFFVWRGSIAPSDVGEWFANYTAVCMQYAALAEVEGVDYFVVGVELNSMERYADEWAALVQNLRDVFSGRITFAESTHHYLAGFNTYNSEPRFEVNCGKIWGALDLIEMNMWPGGLELETQKDQRFSVILENLVEFWNPAIQHYRTEYPMLPLAFGELGSVNVDGTLIATGDIFQSGIEDRLDNQEFADTWAAYLCLVYYFQLDQFCAWSLRLNAIEDRGALWLDRTPALPMLAAFLGGNIEIAHEPFVELTTPVLPTWDGIPYTYFYTGGNVFPDAYIRDYREMPLSEMENWGLEGSDVLGLKLHCDQIGLLVSWSVAETTIQGEYQYELHFWNWPRTIFSILINPNDASASASLTHDGETTDLSGLARVLSVERQSVTAFLSGVTPCNWGSGGLGQWTVIPILIHTRQDGIDSFELPLRKD